MLLNIITKGKKSVNHGVDLDYPANTWLNIDPAVMCF